MKFKKYILLAIVAATVLGTTSCDDLFRDKPNDKLSENVIWGNEMLLDEYVLSWYKNMDNGFSIFVTTMLKGLGREYEPWFTDQMTVSRNDWYSGDYGNILKSDQQVITTRGKNMWAKYYTQIRSINTLLKNQDAIAEGEHKTRVLGEAHFFRAYYYYLLLRMFGGPLLIKEPYDPLHDTTKYPRASYEETMDFIVDEAHQAAELLKATNSSDNVGRPTKGTAYVLAGKAYFWAAGDHFQNVSAETPWLGFSDNRSIALLKKAEAEYDKAKALNVYSLVQISGTTKADIVAGYRQIFLTKNSTESVWEVQHANDGDFSTKNGHKLDRDAASSFFGGTTCAYVPTQNNVDEYAMINGKRINQTGSGYDSNNPYSNRDYRFYANVLYDGAMWNGHEMDIHYTVKNGVTTPGADLTVYGTETSACVTKTGYYLAKFRNETQKIDNDAVYASSQNCIIWRWAEILLDYAEIYYKTERPTDAMDMLNQIRLRVHMPEYTSVTWDDIMNERRVELAFEKSTYWDLLRYGTAETVMSGKTTPLYGVKITLNEDGTYTRKQIIVNTKSNSIRYFRHRQYFWPIAWDDVRYHGITQNPEWIEM